MAQSTELTIRQALSLRDFMHIREIRNSCRFFMTRDQSYIGRLRQLRFYRRYFAWPNVKFILYLGENEEHKAVAYGVITLDKDLVPWVSGGILPEFRGHGYGRQLFTFLADRHKVVPVYLEVLEWNIPARNLYYSLGFVGIGIKDQIITMKREKKQ